MLRATEAKKARIDSVDFLRGIAAFAVMLFHYTAQTSIQLREENPLRMVGVYGHWGVPIFFVLSGFVIPYSMHLSHYRIDLIGRFLLKRSIRIEIPYLALITIEVLLILISSLTPWKNGFNHRLDFLNILLHIGYLNGIIAKPWLIPIFWTLAIEFQFYLLIALLFSLVSQKKFLLRFLFIAGLVILSLIFQQQYFVFAYGLFFLSGIVCFQVFSGIIEPKEFVVLLTGILTAVYFQHGLFSFFVIGITVIIILFLKYDGKWSNFLGKISYSIYLIHIPFGGRLLMLTQLYIHDEWIKSLLILVYLATTIFTAWLFFLIIEEPSLRLSKRITY